MLRMDYLRPSLGWSWLCFECSLPAVWWPLSLPIGDMNMNFNSLTVILRLPSTNSLYLLQAAFHDMSASPASLSFLWLLPLGGRHSGSFASISPCPSHPPLPLLHLLLHYLHDPPSTVFQFEMLISLALKSLQQIWHQTWNVAACAVTRQRRHGSE